MLPKQKVKPIFRDVLISGVIITLFEWLCYQLIVWLVRVHTSASLDYGMLTGVFCGNMLQPYIKPLVSRRKDGKVTS